MSKYDIDKYDKVHELLCELDELELAFEVLKAKRIKAEKSYTESNECRCTCNSKTCGRIN